MPHFEFSQRLLLGAALALALVALLRYRSGGYYSSRRRLVLTLLRLATLAALIPVAGGLVWPGEPGPPEVIALEDHSASIDPARAAFRDTFLADLRKRAPAAAIRAVSFGAAPLVQRGAVAGQPLPDPARTNLAAAIETAKALATPGRSTILLLLSDGEETDGSALATLPGLRQAGIPLLACDLSSPAGAEPSIRRVSAPRRVLPGEQFDLGVSVASGTPRQVGVRLLPEAAPPEIREVRLDGREDGEATFALRAPRSGGLRYRLRLEDGAGRTLPAGERALAVPVAAAVPVTLLTNNPYESRALTGLLEQARVPVTVLEPEAWRMLPDLAGNPGVLLLDNVRAAAIGGEGMEKLERLVRTRGAGLLVLGGMLSLGAGDYRDTPLERLLPAVMEAPTRGADAELSLVIVLDASLSMFFRGRGEEVFIGRGPRKMDLAKTAILEISRSLRPGDRIGLLESKDELTWVHRLGFVADHADFEARVMAIKAYGGGINFYSSIREAAAALRADPGAIRHVMVLADANDIDQLEVENIGRSEELIREMAGERVTLSIFALGSPSDKDIAFLRHMALLGRGDFYLVADVLSLPRYFRSEYQKKTGEQLREEEFAPLVRNASPLLRGIDADRLPALGGMNLVTIRTGAEELLVAPTGAPLLAQWRYGRGRTAVFTSDSGAHWAPAWYSWPDAERFWTQLIHELAPRPAPPPLELRGERAGELAHLTLRRGDGRNLPPVAGQVRFEGTGAASAIAPLARLGLHRFAAPLPAGEPGSLALTVGGELLAGEADVRGFLDLPAPAEYSSSGRGRPLLEALARGTGGEVVRTPEQVAARLAPRAPAPKIGLFWLLLVALLGLFGEMLLRY